MIVVVGDPRWAQSDSGPAVAGAPARIAIAAREAGGMVQIVGKAGLDEAAEIVLLGLAARGVGHVAVLRDPAGTTRMEPAASDPDSAADGIADEGSAISDAMTGTSLDAADVDLALRYLTEYRVIVVADRLAEDAQRVVADAARWSGASLIVVGRAEDLAGLPEDATVFSPPDDGDPDGAFATMVGTYAAGLDRGEEPGTAFAAAQAAVGSTAAE